MAGWAPLPEPSVDNDNNFGGYDGDVGPGNVMNRNTDPDNGYGPGPQYPDPGTGVTGKAGYLRDGGDGYSATTMDGSAMEGPTG